MAISTTETVHHKDRQYSISVDRDDEKDAVNIRFEQIPPKSHLLVFGVEEGQRLTAMLCKVFPEAVPDNEEDDE